MDTNYGISSIRYVMYLQRTPNVAGANAATVDVVKIRAAATFMVSIECRLQRGFGWQ
jgi:hypothetical protein